MQREPHQLGSLQTERGVRRTPLLSGSEWWLHLSQSPQEVPDVHVKVSWMVTVPCFCSWNFTHRMVAWLNHHMLQNEYVPQTAALIPSTSKIEIFKIVQVLRRPLKSHLPDISPIPVITESHTDQESLRLYLKTGMTDKFLTDLEHSICISFRKKRSGNKHLLEKLFLGDVSNKHYVLASRQF